MTQISSEIEVVGQFEIAESRPEFLTERSKTLGYETDPMAQLRSHPMGPLR